MTHTARLQREVASRALGDRLDQAYRDGYLEAVGKYARDFRTLLYVAAAGWLLTTALSIFVASGFAR